MLAHPFWLSCISNVFAIKLYVCGTYVTFERRAVRLVIPTDTCMRHTRVSHLCARSNFLDVMRACGTYVLLRERYVYVI